MINILQWIFPQSGGYSVTAESETDSSRPDFIVFKIYGRLGGSNYLYDCMIVESKKTNVAWGSTQDYLGNHMEATSNQGGQIHGLIQIGMNVEFYQCHKPDKTRMGQRYHLLYDVQLVMGWLRHIKQNPLPVI
jgi:hypothetical protein